MSRRTHTLMAAVSLAIVVPAAVVTALPASAATTTRYVGGSGASNSNPGTAAAPLATIQKCADLSTPGDTCSIRSGTYRETIKPPSGTSGAPVTFAAEPGAQVTVSGTDVVSGWTLDSAKVYKASVSLAPGYDATLNPANTQLAANQIFVGGQMMPEAQFPNVGLDVMSPVRATMASASSTTSGSTVTTTFTDSTIPAGSLTGATVYVTGGWAAVSGTVTGRSGSSVTFTMPTSDYNVYPPSKGSDRYRITNSRSLLDAENEWFYDAGTLYLWAPGGGAPTGVEAKKRNYAFDLRGRSWVTVQGVNVTAATITTDSSSTNNVLDGVNGRYLSHFMTVQYDSTLPYGGVYDAGHRADTGILLHGANNTLRNSTLVYSAGNAVSVDGNAQTVDNNLIHDIAYGATYTSGIAVEGGSSGHAITRNTIYNMARDGINLNTNIAAKQTYQNIRIAYNDVSGYGMFNNDLGAIYTCCKTDWTGSSIDHNYAHDGASEGTGIYLDNGTHNILVHHNVLWNNTESAIGINGVSGYANSGKDIKLYNNVLDGPLNMTGGIDSTTGSILRNNVYRSYTSVSPGATTDHNLASGTDPKFVDQPGRDYRVQTTSPALGAGIAVPGVTVTSTGSADIGAYEAGASDWTAGCEFGGCRAAVAGQVSVDDQVTGTGPNQFAYTGTWGSSASCCPEAYNSSNSWSDDPAASVTIPFTGTTIALYGITDPAHGIGAVSIDGSAPVDVDFYSSSRAGNVRLWTSPPLSAGTHTLRLAVTGRKNTASTGTYVALDRVAIDTSPVSSGSTYTIANVGSGKLVDVPGASTTAGTQLIQWTGHGGTNQQWTFTANADGSYQLKNVASGLCVDVNGGSSAAGTAIIQWTCHSGDNQQWLVEASTDGAYLLRSVGTHLVLGAADLTEGAPLTQQLYSAGTATRRWTFTKV
ncbi:hypothetical protein Lfu02_79000 [Longispora fulva]|uniref:Ricin B lectin domain-containing protein n=1 Tax=Longispora fulva TaxID=619741 RepID=A0A8J7GP66_9ACTN|nr:RICIN domain-containing protein [Longispora fulva]MBG6136349.1 hypothetical protein [Longispora fulva]GIG63528.1 hypothetical protein Lfu02_79000 [Longispora fulva]